MKGKMVRVFQTQIRIQTNPTNPVNSWRWEND